MNESFWFWRIWFIVAVILMVAEMLTGTFVLLFFSIACIISAICAACNLSLTYQLVSFCVTCILGTALFFKKKKKINHPKRIANSERFIGQIGTVIQDIKEYGTGLVNINNERWSASSEDQNEIKAGEKVQIQKISGVRLIVTKYYK